MSTPASILHKSIAGRYRPVRVADGPMTDGPMTARYRFTMYVECLLGLTIYILRRNMKKISQNYHEILLLNNSSVFPDKGF